MIETYQDSSIWIGGTSLFCEIKKVEGVGGEVQYLLLKVKYINGFVKYV